MSGPAKDFIDNPGDPALSDGLRLTVKIIWKILSPITGIAQLLVTYAFLSIAHILRLLYEPIAFTLLPVVFLVRFTWLCIVAPFRFAARFETIYIFLGIAALVGLTGGSIISLLCRVLKEPLGLSSRTAKPAKPAKPGRTAKEWRAKKQQQKPTSWGMLSLQHDSGYSSANRSSDVKESRRGRSARTLLSSTIMEEMDSDY